MVKPYWEGNHGVEPGSYFGIEPNLSNLLLSSDCLYRLPDRHLVAKMCKELCRPLSGITRAILDSHHSGCKHIPKDSVKIIVLIATPEG